ncbi:MAG: hypothetical protein ACOYLX_12250 [Burkholderiaceae bacterium]
MSATLHQFPTARLRLVPPICVHRGCIDRALWRCVVTFELVAGEHRARYDLRLPGGRCSLHALPDIDYVMPREDWRKLSDAFTANGLPPLEARHAQVRFEVLPR